MSGLQKVYERLAKNPNDLLYNIDLYHSDIHYCRAHINAKFGTDYTLKEMYNLLKEEKLI